MPGPGTSENRFILELDGVPIIQASEVSGGMLEHTAVKLYESNRANPHLVRGNYEVKDLTVKQGHAINGAGDAFFLWMELYIKGLDPEKRSCRLIIMDETGLIPDSIYQLTNCVPKQFGPDSHNASGTNPSYFSFVITPEDMLLV